jgi:hypothetical protein
MSSTIRFAERAPVAFGSFRILRCASTSARAARGGKKGVG